MIEAVALGPFVLRVEEGASVGPLEWAAPAPSPDLNDPDILRLVTSIYRKNFAKRLIAFGFEREDAYQSVIVEMLHKARLRGSRWDPARGGLSTWAYVALSGIVSNLIDQHVRAERRNGSTGFERDVADEHSTTQTLASLGSRRGSVSTHQISEHLEQEEPPPERRSQRSCRLHTEPEAPPPIRRRRYNTHVQQVA